MRWPWPTTVALAWGIPWMIGVRWPFQYGRLTLPLLFVTYAVALDRLVLPHIEPREPPANASHSTSI